MKRALHIVCLLAVLLLATGCFKKVTTATTLVIKPMVEAASGAGATNTDEAFGYIYYTDTKDWEIKSYDDAEAKIITSTATAEQRTTPDVESEPYTYKEFDTKYIAMSQASSPALVVVVYPPAKMYAYMWRNSEAENLPETFLTLIFHEWKTATYPEGKGDGYSWTVVPFTSDTTTQQ